MFWYTSSFTLRNVLDAVGAESDNDPAEELLWKAHPHVTPDSEAASVVALVLAQGRHPAPEPSEPAAEQPFGSDIFDNFLAGFDTEFTDPACTYLMAQQDAGIGDMPLSERHLAGMRAVMNEVDAMQLVTDLCLGPHPDGDKVLSTLHVLADLMNVRLLRRTLNTYF